VIAPGKRTDLLVVTGDPSHNIVDIERIRSVWKGGRQVVSIGDPR
jgi:imidazolonepropionase-like amidohydrolase